MARFATWTWAVAAGAWLAAAGCGGDVPEEQLMPAEPACSEQTPAHAVSDTPVCGGATLPQRLERVGSAAVAPPGSSEIPVDVYVTHGHAYVVSVNGGLTVFDVSDPTAPVLRKRERIATDAYWNGVWAREDALYVATMKSGVRIYDLLDPANPVYVTSVPQDGSVHTVFVAGTLLLAAANGLQGGVLVYDVSAPKAPVLRSFYRSPRAGEARYGVHDMFVFEDRLYVNYWDLGLEVVDLKDPTKPTFLGAYRYEHAQSHATAVVRQGDRLYAFEGGEGTGEHLRVLDVTDPADIRLVTRWQRSARDSIHNFVHRDGRLYVAHYAQGNWVLDVSDPTRPCELATDQFLRPEVCQARPPLGAIGMRVPGDGYVYGVDSAHGLWVLREPPR